METAKGAASVRACCTGATPAPGTRRVAGPRGRSSAGGGGSERAGDGAPVEPQVAGPQRAVEQEVGAVGPALVLDRAVAVGGEPAEAEGVGRADVEGQRV